MSGALRVAKVLASLAVTVLGLIAVTFIIGRVIPIDPVLSVVGDRASAATYEAARQAMGLDRSLAMQFWIYLEGVVRGDFGTSVVTARPVIEDIGRYFPATIELATIAILIGVALGVPGGVLAAVHRGRWPDQLLRLLSLFGYSTPTFWLGMVALAIFYAWLGWAVGPGRVDIFYEDLIPPVTGFLVIDAMLEGEWVIAGNAVAHLVLPAAVLGLSATAYICA